MQRLRSWLCVLLLLAASTAAYGQSGGAYSTFSITLCTSRTISTAVCIMPSVRVQVCPIGVYTYACPSPVALCTDITCNVKTAPNPFSPTSNGKVSLYAPTGNYTVQYLSLTGTWLYEMPITVGGTGGGGGGGGSMTWPSTGGIPIYNGAQGWGASVAAPIGTIVGTTDTQTITNKTVDGVSPTTFSYLDLTSSVQTQLNGKQALLNYPVTSVGSGATAGHMAGCQNAACTSIADIGAVPGAIGSLTTTGTSGAATYVGGVLNIPNYSGVSSINSTLGAFTFSGSGVNCTGGSCVFTVGSITGASVDGSGNVTFDANVTYSSGTTAVTKLTSTGAWATQFGVTGLTVTQLPGNAGCAAYVAGFTNPPAGYCTPYTGEIIQVSDATSNCTVGAGGGGVTAFVYYNGSSWVAASGACNTTLGAANGGSGIASPTIHNLMVAEGASAFNLIAPSSTAGMPLVSQGSSADPAYGTLVNGAIPAVATIVNSGSISAVANSTMVICTTTCTVTPITPAAGVQLCVRNAPNISSVITLAALTNVYYEKTDHSGWAANADHTMTSGGATSDMVCIVGYDPTHYLVINQSGMTVN